MPKGQLYNHAHFQHNNFRSTPVRAGKKACVDYHGPGYYMWGTGQCCDVNLTKEQAQLVNPAVGEKHWYTISGQRIYNVTCQ